MGNLSSFSISLSYWYVYTTFETSHTHTYCQLSRFKTHSDEQDDVGVVELTENADLIHEVVQSFLLQILLMEFLHGNCGERKQEGEGR